MTRENTASTTETGTRPGPARLILGCLNRARLGFPSRIFAGAGGIGDDLLCTAVLHEIKKRKRGRLGMMTVRPELFEGNPDVDIAIVPDGRRSRRIFFHGLPVTQLAYSAYDTALDRDAPLDEHVLVKICRLAGIRGEIELRPWFFLSPAERAAGKLHERQIVIQSSALAAPYPMKNKEWYIDRFQWVADQLAGQGTLVQIGSAPDPLIHGARDLRGKTSLRESAAILANALVFIGLETFLMHLARAVECRSVIIYGGRLLPRQIGYSANANLTGPTPCSPCWLRNDCPYDRACMNMITAESALEAAQKQLGLHGAPLETEMAVI
ncbi:MAG TPA: glycosyltransferase family 9 protein [Chthoniobacteraceae bacterium]|nr:glycosyltransferase family 9 protein [Chthoniobacteraceae bacterium]